MKDHLEAPLIDDVDGWFSQFIWLRQFEIGDNSVDMNLLLDQLEVLPVKFRCHQLVGRREWPDNGEAERIAERLKATLLSEP